MGTSSLQALSSVEMIAQLVPKEGTFPHHNTVYLGEVQKVHPLSWKGHDGEIIQVVQYLGMGPSPWPVLSWLKGVGRNRTEEIFIVAYNLFSISTTQWEFCHGN